jgi:hypothetical protein
VQLPKISVKDVVYQIVFSYLIYVGGLMVGINANNTQSWWFQGFTAFTAAMICYFSIYNVKSLRDLELRLNAKNDTSSMQVEIDCLKRRVKELEGKSIKTL